MACHRQRLTDAGNVSVLDTFGQGERGQLMGMNGILSGLVEFTLQILLVTSTRSARSSEYPYARATSSAPVN